MDSLSNPKKNSTYTSPQIQNEILELLANEVLSNITRDIRKAGYFTLIVDSTQDITKKEQLSLSIRFVGEFGYPEERFLKFVDIPSGSAETFYSVIKEELARLNLDLTLCRGQAYDGASAMSGHLNGLQSKIKADVPEAIYVHCCAHKLNLALVDSVNSCVAVKLFFGTLEKIYVFITESFPRLKCFQDIQGNHGKTLSLKKLSTTRWASHTKAVNSIFENLSAIIEVLESISSGEITSTNASQMIDARGILTYVKSFEFIYLLCFWKQTLSVIQILSNYLQKVDINISAAVSLIKSTINNLKLLRTEESFNSFEEKAREISSRYDLPDEFTKKRPKKVTLFHDENASRHVENCPRQNFKISVYFFVLDTFIQTLTQRFEDFFLVANKFSCLEAENIAVSEKNIKALYDLCIFYKSSIQPQLVDEYKSFCSLFTEINEEYKLKTEEIYPFLISKKLVSVFPNVCKIYRIFLTIPTNTATGERSFNRLRNIKTYNRSTMSEDRLTNIALLNIERDYASNIDLQTVIDKFKTIKSRRIIL